MYGHGPEAIIDHINDNEDTARAGYGVALSLLLHILPEQVCVGEPGEVLLRVELSDDDSEPVLLDAGQVRVETD